MASTNETWKALLDALNSNTVRFEPIRGLHKDIEVLPTKDGSLYFAYDTGAIFLDVKTSQNGVEEVRRFQMGGTGSGGSGNSGFVYTNATINDETLVKVHDQVDDYNSPAYYVYQKAFQYEWTEQQVLEEGSDGNMLLVYKPNLKPEDDWGPMPGKDTLLVNSNGWLLRVVEPQTAQRRVVANLISSGSTSGGSGGGGGSSSEDDLKWTLSDGWGSNSTYIYGQDNELTIVPISTRDNRVSISWIITDTINNEVLVQKNEFVTSGNTWVFNTKTLPLSDHGLKIEVYLDSASSRMYNNYKPKMIAENVTVFRMDLTKTNPNAFLALKGLAGSDSDHNLSYIATGSSYTPELLHVYVDGEEYSTSAISSDQDGRESTVTIQKQSHGVHTVDLQLTTVISGITLYSNVISYQVAWGDDDALAPIVWIGNYDPLIVNYETSYIKYMVYDPAVTEGNQIQVYLYKNGEEISQVGTTYSNQTKDWLTWDITSLYDAPPETAPEGTTATTNFSISVRGVKVDIQVEVTNEGSRDLKLVNSQSLLCNYSTIGRSNDEVIANRGIVRSLTHGYQAELINFNWKNNGWNRDEIGVDGIDNGSYLTVANGASVSLPIPTNTTTLMLNSANAPYSIEIRFRIRNVQAYSTLVKTIPYYYYLDSEGNKSASGATEEAIEANKWKYYKDADGNLEMDEAHSEKVTETENGIVMKWLNDDNYGFCLGTQEAYFRTPAGVANVRYAEDQVINISFVIDPNTQLCYIYLNGILSGAAGLPDPGDAGSSFTMNRPFTINSNYCDFDLYRFRVYNRGLSMPDVIHNYLSDLHSIALYDQNNLTRNTDATELDYDALVAYNKNHPGQLTMPYAVWTLDKPVDEDVLPFYKGNNKSVSIDFVNPCLDEALENKTITEWFYYTHSPSYTSQGVDINVQGTSSQKYPRRNFKTKYKNAKKKWVYTKGPLAGYPVNEAYYFYAISDNVLLSGKCVMKSVTKEVIDESGATVQITEEVPDTNPVNTTGLLKLVKNWHMDQEAVATNKFTWKIDYMESSGSYNTGFANLMGNSQYPFYLKHPIEDLGSGFSGEGLRTSVYGFPVLVFQKFTTEAAKRTYNNGFDYKYIGRYNKNLDKSSNEYFGFENSSEHPYVIKPWNEYKVTTITRKDPNNYNLTTDTTIDSKKTYYIKVNNNYIIVDNPTVENIGNYYEQADLYKYVLTEDTDINRDKTYFTKNGTTYTAVENPSRNNLEDYYEYVKDTYDEYTLNAIHSKPTVNQIAECWELRDNQGTWCSFRYPDKAARSAGFGALVDKTEGDNAQLEVVKHFEYRYTPYDDPMDDAMVYKSFQDENGVMRTNRSDILKYLREKYSNLEEVFNWLDSTDPSSVPDIADAKFGDGIRYGPWVTSVDCTGEGDNTSEAVFTYQAVTNSAFFDPEKQYYLRVNNNGNYEYILQENLNSLDVYTPLTLVMEQGSLALPSLNGSNTYYELINNEYTPIISSRLIIPGTTDMIVAEPLDEEETYSIEYAAQFKLYNFVQTTDTVIDAEKVYYVYKNGIYIVETSPLAANLNSYYEAQLSDTAIPIYTKSRPNYYQKIINYYNTYFTHDTRNYRIAKFRNEFSEHFDKEYCLVYFILTELLLCYDSRGKNMMLASWGPTSQKYVESNYLLTNDQDIVEGKTYYTLEDNSFIPVEEPSRDHLIEYYEVISAANVNNAYIKNGNIFNRATSYNANATYYRPVTGPYVWYPIFYDIDTQLGLNNSGAYLWDYDADVTANNIFSTPNSVLWNNFYEVFYDDIVAKYRVLRGTQDDKSAINGSLNYKAIAGAYECDPTVFDSYAMRGVRPVVAIGLDEYYKYLAPTKFGFWDVSGSWQRLSEYSYAYTCQGDKKLTTELLLQNRLNYLDSQWLGGNYTAAQVLTEIFIRANANQSGTSDTFLDPEGYTNLTPAGKNRFTAKPYFNENGLFNNNGLDARAGYKIKPYLHQSVTYFVDNQPVSPVRYDGRVGQEDGVLTNVSPDVLAAYRVTPDVSQQINYIPAADYISSLGDLSLSYPNSIQIFKGKKMLDLNIGSDHPSYVNPLLNAQSDFSLAELPLLRSANFSGLTNFGRRVDLSKSAKLQEFKALNSTLTMVSFAPGAPLTTVLLPKTITSLSLKGHQELKNILTTKPTLASIDDSTGEVSYAASDTYKGLYLENITDIEDKHDIGHTLSTIEIDGGKLEYNSYTILKNLITLKDNAVTNTNLSINYYDVHWSPYTLVERGTSYDRNISYFQITDHSTFINYTYTDANTWETDLLNELIYTCDNTAAKETIQNLNLLDKFIVEYEAAANSTPIKLNQFCGPRQAIPTMPTITGSLYVDNETPIYELTKDNIINPLKTYYVLNGGSYIKVNSPNINDMDNYYEDVALIDEAELTSYWAPHYPSLQITAARVLESNVTKYVNVLDSGKEEIVEIKRGANEHPLELSYIMDGDTKFYPNNPKKTNYDFLGWAFDKAGTEMFINYDVNSDSYSDFESNLNTYTFTNENRVLTLYAIFRIHPYEVTFLNDDGSLLEVVYNDYSVLPGLKECSKVPTSSKGGLTSEQVYTWLGWTRKVGDSLAIGLSNLQQLTPTTDYTFVATYESTPSNVYESKNILNKKYLITEFDTNTNGYNIGLNPNYQIYGKITLPLTIDDIPITGLGTTEGASFSNTTGFINRITHIFWEKETDDKKYSLLSISANCFAGDSYLEYYEQPTSCITIGNGAFTNCSRLGLNNPDVFYNIMMPIRNVGATIFASNRATTINLPGHSYNQTTTTQWFGGMYYTAIVNIGKKGDPCTWEDMVDFINGFRIFQGLGSSSSAEVKGINLYTSTGTASDALKTNFGVTLSTINIVQA